MNKNAPAHRSSDDDANSDADARATSEIGAVSRLLHDPSASHRTLSRGRLLLDAYGDSLKTVALMLWRAGFGMHQRKVIGHFCVVSIIIMQPLPHVAPESALLPSQQRRHQHKHHHH
jgi:hypothetical protein